MYLIKFITKMKDSAAKEKWIYVQFASISIQCEADFGVAFMIIIFIFHLKKKKNRAKKGYP